MAAQFKAESLIECVLLGVFVEWFMVLVFGCLERRLIC